MGDATIEGSRRHQFVLRFKKTDRGDHRLRTEQIGTDIATVALPDVTFRRLQLDRPERQHRERHPVLYTPANVSSPWTRQGAVYTSTEAAYYQSRGYGTNVYPYHVKSHEELYAPGASSSATT
jgi:hypothetical protein